MQQKIKSLVYKSEEANLVKLKFWTFWNYKNFIHFTLIFFLSSLYEYSVTVLIFPSNFSTGAGKDSENKSNLSVN